MGAQLRVVRRRIRSVQSTMKITRAMELIAASRIVKAQQRVQSARPSAGLLTAAEEGGRRLIADFAARVIDEVHCAYTDFRSAFTFRAADKRFVPIAPEEVVAREPGRPQPEYIFEPAPAAILDGLLPAYVVTNG